MKTEMILKEGYPFILSSGALFVLSLIFHFNGFFQLILFLIFAFFVYFFRNPERVPEDTSKNAIISPSDGEIIEIVKTKSPILQEEMIKISIRLGLLDVHVQRAPIDGKISAKEYVHGTFLSLNSPKASELNEQNRVLFENENAKVVVNQIAGLITRRIVMFKDLESVQKAERYGMIMFGSQVDIYLPVNTEVKVTEFQKVKAGESVIGYLDEN
jgi:phosphatidylserine decarboxylase